MRRNAAGIRVDGQHNPNWRGGPVKIVCQSCHSEIAVKRGSQGRGRFCSRKCANDWQKSNPYTGRRGGKFAKKNCRNCGCDFEVHESKAQSTRCCSRKCQGEWRSKAFVGPASPTWQGGISMLPYPFDWRRTSDRIMDRDGHECRNPLCPGSVGGLNVHHIDYDKQNCGDMNLVTVCAGCNGRANFGREKWTQFYQNVQLARFAFTERA